jgi:hypothetical protein
MASIRSWAGLLLDLCIIAESLTKPQMGFRSDHRRLFSYLVNNTATNIVSQ